MATHVRPSLAPALVASRLLGLLARPMTLKIVQVATRASPGMAMLVRPTLAPALVALRLLGLIARPLAIGFVQVAMQASPWRAVHVRQANICNGISGTATSGASGTSVDDCNCASCEAGSTLNGKACQANTCTCLCITVATGNGKACQAFTCTCTSGTAATGAFGTFDGVCFVQVATRASP